MMEQGGNRNMENYENNNVETPVVEPAPVQENPYASQGYANYNAQPPMSKEEFLKHYAPASFKKTILVTSIIAYVLVVIALIGVIAGNIWGILDVAITLGLTLGVHIAKSKGCAIGLLVYGIINVVIASLAMGMLAGWGWVAVPIAYLVAFSQAEKEYKAVYGA